MIVRRGRQAGVDAWPHRFRHHFSHTWLGPRGGTEGDLMELNGWSSRRCSPLRGQRPQRPSPPHLRSRHDRPAMTQPASCYRLAVTGRPAARGGFRASQARSAYAA